jgi:hypothetical protein
VRVWMLVVLRFYDWDCRKFNALSKESEEKKEAFIEIEKQDVRCREDMTHTRAKGKKMVKQLEQEQKKVI